MKQSFDYVVAGAGSAGCALAARLAEDPEIQVCLIEAGGNGRSLWAQMPSGNGFLFGNPRFDWNLKSVPQSTLNGRRIHYPRGKGVGGSSLINGMIYIRGTAGDFDRWHDKGLSGWSYSDVLPYFRRAFGAIHRSDNPYHGDSGPVKLTPAANYERLNELFVEAAHQAGNPLNCDFNGANQRGVGRLDVTVWKGRRQSTREAYLRNPPPNLTILTDSRVLKVRLDGQNATGLTLDRAEIHARREVILSLGAFGSPHLLMLSGIGPANHLRSIGIPVACDLPGVGSSLYDHPQMPIKYELLKPALSLSRYQRIDRAVAMGINYFLTKGGPAAAPFWSSALFRSLRDNNNPELEIYMTPMCVKDDDAVWSWTAENIFNIGNLLINRGKSAIPGIQFEVNINRPRSCGTVRLASDDPFAPPVIDPQWFTDPADMEDMVTGLQHVREIVGQHVFNGIVGTENIPGYNIRSDEELAESVRQHVSTGHHPVSTCRMGGEDDTGAVLDGEFRVRGIDSLRVVDASSFPDQIGGNINATVIMLAEKAADMIRGRSPLPPEFPEVSQR